MARQLGSYSNPSAVLKNPYLKMMMEKLFEQRKQTGDIKFIIAGVEIRAHRCVLAALSPRYEAQFYGDLAENDTITVEDVMPAAFEEFLQFFYSHHVTLTLDNIEDVLNLAKQSLVDELVAECSHFIINNIGVDKLLWCYELALRHDMKVLEEFCEKHIGMNTSTVFKTAEFLGCEHAVLCGILNLDTFNCMETDVFDACIGWAMAKCERDCIDAADTVNLRSALGKALFKIRFCSMSSEEFANISRQYAGLLTPQESIEVFEAIALKSNGEHSNTFGAINSVQRKRKLTNLECVLAKGRPIPFMERSRICVIEFWTNKAISLNGFVLCNKIDDDIRPVIDIGEHVYDQNDAELFNTKITSENETKIIFHQPIRIEAESICVLSVASNAFVQPNSGLYGFALEKQTTQHGVQFTQVPFTFVNPNLFKRLLFDIVDTP